MNNSCFFVTIISVRRLHTMRLFAPLLLTFGKIYSIISVYLSGEYRRISFMKKIARIILVCTLALTAVLTCSCKKQQTIEVVDGTTADGKPSIIGNWIAPDPINAELTEIWVFESDSKTYHLYQLDKSNNVINAIDGTYALRENDTLDVTMMGYTLTYTYSLTNANTMVLSDHGTDATYIRFTGEIKK